MKVQACLCYSFSLFGFKVLEVFGVQSYSSFGMHVLVCLAGCGSTFSPSMSSELGLPGRRV